MGAQASKDAPTEAEKIIINKDAPRIHRITDACAQTRDMAAAFHKELARFNKLDTTDSYNAVVEVHQNCEELEKQFAALHELVVDPGMHFTVLRPNWEPRTEKDGWRVKVVPEMKKTADLFNCAEQLISSVHHQASDNFRWLQSCAARHVKAKTKPVEEWANLHSSVSDFRAKFEETVFVVLDEIALAFADLLEMCVQPQLDSESQKLLTAYSHLFSNDNYGSNNGTHLITHHFPRVLTSERRNALVALMETWLLTVAIPNFGSDDEPLTLTEDGIFLRGQFAGQTVEEVPEWMFFAATIILPDDAPLERVLTHILLASVELNSTSSGSKYSFAAKHIDRLLTRVAASTSHQLQLAQSRAKDSPFSRNVTLLDVLWAATHLQISGCPNGRASNPDGLKKAVISKAAARLVSALPISEWENNSRVGTDLPHILKENRWYREGEVVVWTNVWELLAFVEGQSKHEATKHSGYQNSRMSEIRDAGNHARMLEIFLLWHRLSAISDKLCGDVLGVIIDFHFGWGRIAAPRKFFKRLRVPAKK